MRAADAWIFLWCATGLLQFSASSALADTRPAEHPTVLVEAVEQGSVDDVGHLVLFGPFRSQLQFSSNDGRAIDAVAALSSSGAHDLAERYAHVARLRMLAMMLPFVVPGAASTGLAVLWLTGIAPGAVGPVRLLVGAVAAVSLASWLITPLVALGIGWAITAFAVPTDAEVLSALRGGSAKADRLGE